VNKANDAIQNLFSNFFEHVKSGSSYFTQGTVKELCEEVFKPYLRPYGVLSDDTCYTPKDPVDFCETILKKIMDYHKIKKAEDLLNEENLIKIETAVNDSNLRKQIIPNNIDRDIYTIESKHIPNIG